MYVQFLIACFWVYLFFFGFSAYTLSITSTIAFDYLIFMLTAGRTIYVLRCEKLLLTSSSLYRMMIKDGALDFFTLLLPTFDDFYIRLGSMYFMLVLLFTGSSIGDLISKIE